MAVLTRSRMSSDTYPVLLTTSETVLSETPASFATSRMPTIAQHLSPASSGCFLTNRDIMCYFTCICNVSLQSFAQYELSIDERRPPPLQFPRKIHFFTRERRMFHDAFHASSTHAPHVLHTRSARKRGGATLAIISLASHRPLRCVAWPSAVTSSHHVSPHHGRTDRHAFGTEPSWEWSKTGLLSASYL